MPLLLPYFQILRFDARGHGASDAPAVDYSFELLAQDVIAVMNDAKVPQAVIAGVLLGGMIAMETALRYSERVIGLALICTSAGLERALWAERVERVRKDGVAVIADAAMTRFLSPRFANSHPNLAAAIQRTLLTTQGYAGAAAAIRDGELRDRVASITAPTVIVSGNQDISLPFVPHSKLRGPAGCGASHSQRVDRNR